MKATSKQQAERIAAAGAAKMTADKYETANEIPTDADLTAAIEGTGEATEREEFHITDAGRADWLLGKLAGIEAERALVKAQAAAMIAQLDADEKGLRDRFEAELREWGVQELARRGRGRKSLPLLHGTLSYRRVPACLRVADEGAALNEATARGLIKVDVSGYRAAALEAKKATGELLPGVELVPEYEKFSVRFGKDSAPEETGE